MLGPRYKRRREGSWQTATCKSQPQPNLVASHCGANGVARIVGVNRRGCDGWRANIASASKEPKGKKSSGFKRRAIYRLRPTPLQTQIFSTRYELFCQSYHKIQAGIRNLSPILCQCRRTVNPSSLCPLLLRSLGYTRNLPCQSPRTQACSSAVLGSIFTNF